MTVTCQCVASVSDSLVPSHVTSKPHLHASLATFIFTLLCIEIYFFMLHAFSSPGLRIVFFCLLLLIHLC